ncbi:hypothetical protein GW750_03665 [bacterium]|nr:hypothetical protein [bacterium]
MVDIDHKSGVLTLEKRNKTPTMSYTLLCFFHTCMSDLAAFDTPEQEQKKEVQQEIATTFKDFF